MFLDGEFLFSSLFGSISLLIAAVFSFTMRIIYSPEFTYLFTFMKYCNVLIFTCELSWVWIFQNNEIHTATEKMEIRQY